MIKSFCIVSCISLGLISTAFADGINITQPWLRSTKGAHRATAGYMQMENHGAQTRQLTKAAVLPDQGIKAIVEIHETTVNDGIFSMNTLENGVTIPANTTVRFAPKSYHLMLMLMGSERQLEEGRRVQIALTFANGVRKNITFRVLNEAPEN